MHDDLHCAVGICNSVCGLLYHVPYASSHVVTSATWSHTIQTYDLEIAFLSRPQRPQHWDH